MENLKELGWLDFNGKITADGLHILASLLGGLPLVHQGKWREAFVPMVSKLVRVCVDLAVIKDHQVLLKWRKDEFWEGWEMPGGSLGPGESWEDASNRLAEEEFGLKVRFGQRLGAYNNTDNLRAHDLTVLLLCEPISEPREGRWFQGRPPDIISVHQKYWPAVRPYLRD